MQDTKTTTVKELIEKLEKFDPNLPVYVEFEEAAFNFVQVAEAFICESDPYYSFTVADLERRKPREVEQDFYKKIVLII